MTKPGLEQTQEPVETKDICPMKTQAEHRTNNEAMFLVREITQKIPYKIFFIFNSVSLRCNQKMLNSFSINGEDGTSLSLAQVKTIHLGIWKLWFKTISPRLEIVFELKARVVTGGYVKKSIWHWSMYIQNQHSIPDTGWNMQIKKTTMIGTPQT